MSWGDALADPAVVAGMITLASIAVPLAVDDLVNGTLDAEEIATIPLPDLLPAWVAEGVANGINEGLTD